MKGLEICDLALLLCSLLFVSSWVHGAEADDRGTSSGDFTTFQKSNFNKDFFVAWSDPNVRAVDQGRTLQLMLTQNSGTYEMFHSS